MTVGVVGAGRWGAALANLLQEAGHEVILFCLETDFHDLRRRDRRVAFSRLRVNDEVILAKDNIKMDTCEIVFFAVDGEHFQAAYQQWRIAVTGTTVIACKTIGVRSGRLVLPIEMINGNNSRTAYFASGAFPEDIASSSPVQGTVYGLPKLTSVIQGLFPKDKMRVYTSTDTAGGQIAAACKNTLALACGIALGLGKGEMTRAMIAGRGLEHMVKFATAEPYNALPDTFSPGSTAAIDTFGTCFSDHSRNLRAGIEIVKGASIKEIEGSIGKVEGLRTTAILTKVNGALDAMPIASAVAEILFGGSTPEAAMARLLDRQVLS